MEGTTYTGSKLVFLISQPSSGSSLLQQVIGNHTLIHTLPETWLMLHPSYALKEKGIDSEYSHFLSRNHLAAFLKNANLSEQDYWHATRQMLGHLYEKAMSGRSERLFLDKTPRYYLVWKEIASIFPEARFILLVRNPMAVLGSIMNIIERKRWASLYRQNYLDMVVAPTAIAQAKSVLGNKCTLVRYEQFLANPIKLLTEIMAFLGLEYEQDQEHYGYLSEGEWGDNSGNIKRHSSPQPQEPDHWLSKFDTGEKRAIAHYYLKQLLDKEAASTLGYDVEKLSSKLGSSSGASFWQVGPELFFENPEEPLFVRAKRKLMIRWLHRGSG